MVWNVNPILLHLGPFVVRWYSLLFAGGFLVGYFVIRKMFEAEGRDAGEPAVAGEPALPRLEDLDRMREVIARFVPRGKDT
jgi:Prolipoprotein diacylglyceryl transferase